MRLERPRRTERFGAVRISEAARVIELDSGGVRGPSADPAPASVAVPADAVRAIQADMVIVVPCMNETRSVIEGVLAGIPHDCLIVLVSNSDRGPVDRYELEARTVERFCRYAERPALAVHQRDPGLAAAIRAAGMPELIDGRGLVRSGKGEAMLVGMALAALTGRRHIGYVDADNFAPGAVHEYCTAYAAGLHVAGSSYAMVRISWQSKPKLRDGRLFFSRRGRSSEVTNRFLNRMLAEHSGAATDVISTGNAGEHAMSLALGTRMRWAGGFAAEPYQLLELFERFGPAGQAAACGDVAGIDGAAAVPVVQIGTRNPHFHSERGEGHVRGMRTQALNVLYHCSAAGPAVRREVAEFLVAEGALRPGEEPPRERIYPPVDSLAPGPLLDTLAGRATSFRRIAAGRPALTGVEPAL